MPTVKEKPSSRFKVQRKSFHGGCEAEMEKWLGEMADDGWVLVATSQDGAASLFIFEKS